jgi:hypothetical protein
MQETCLEHVHQKDHQVIKSLMPPEELLHRGHPFGIWFPRFMLPNITENLQTNYFIKNMPGCMSFH